MTVIGRATADPVTARAATASRNVVFGDIFGFSSADKIQNLWMRAPNARRSVWYLFDCYFSVRTRATRRTLSVMGTAAIRIGLIDSSPPGLAPAAAAATTPSRA